MLKWRLELTNITPATVEEWVFAFRSTQMKSEQHSDPGDPRTVHLRMDPDWHCDGCPKYAKCLLRQAGHEDRCDRARGRGK